MTPIWESTVPLNCRSTCAEATHEIARSVVRAQVKRGVDVCTVFKKAPERQIRNCGEMLDGSGLETHYRTNVDRPTVIANNYANFFANWNYFGVQASQVPCVGAITCVYLLNTAAQVVQVPRLNFLARPGSLAQKSQTGFYAWVACETAHVNSLRQSFPTMTLHQDCQDGFKSHALKWIVRMLSHSM